MSLYLSLVFKVSRDISLVSSHLLSDIYPSRESPNMNLSLLLSLLHNLVVGFPSQTSFHQVLSETPRPFVSSNWHSWSVAVAKNLRVSDFVSFNKLTTSPHLPSFGPNDPPLGIRAFDQVIASLRERARTRFWAVIRSAYREVALPSDAESRLWLSHSLCLLSSELDGWVEMQAANGQLRRKDGSQDRWTVIRG